MSDLACYWVRLITCRGLRGGKYSSYIRVSPAVLLLRDYTAWTATCFIVSTDGRSGLDKRFVFFSNSAVGVWHWSALWRQSRIYVDDYSNFTLHRRALYLAVKLLVLHLI